MIKSKKGISFIAVVATVFFMATLSTICYSFVGNNGLLVNKYASDNKIYAQTSDSLTQAANLLVEKSSGESLEVTAIVSLVNTKLSLPTVFGINAISSSDIQIVAKNELAGIPVNGKQVRLSKEGFYINVFLSDDGSQKSLSNIFFDNKTSLDAIYKTGFLTASYIYEQGLFYDGSTGPVKTGLNSTDQNKVSQALLKNDEVYNTILPKERKDSDSRFEYNEETSAWQYRESYIDNDVIDEAIELCFPSNSSKYNTKWSNKSSSTFSGTTFISGNVTLSTINTNEIKLNDNAIVYISGDLNMDFSYVEERSGTKAPLSTMLTLGKNATLYVKGDIIIKNEYLMPTINLGSKANVICAGDITIEGQHDLDLTTNSDFYKWYLNGKKFHFIYTFLNLFLGDDYFKNMEKTIKGEISGTFITGNDFKVKTSTKGGTTPPNVPISATIYADNRIDLTNAYLAFSAPSFLFASEVAFFSNSDTSLSTMIDYFLDRFPATEYLFVIVDDGIEYRGKTNNLKANIFTTNQNNTDEVVKQINTAYETGSSSSGGGLGNRVMNSIFNWIGINQDIQNVGKNEVDVKVDELGLPKVLTEGSTDQSYSSNVKK